MCFRIGWDFSPPNLKYDTPYDQISPTVLAVGADATGDKLHEGR